MWHNIHMRLLFVADGRSPIALNWIRYFVERGDEVHLASTFACRPDLELKGLDIVPVAFSGTKRPSAAHASRPASARVLSLSRTLRLGSAQALGLRTAIRHFLGPLTIARSAKNLKAVIARVKPGEDKRRKILGSKKS